MTKKNKTIVIIMIAICVSAIMFLYFRIKKQDKDTSLPAKSEINEGKTLENKKEKELSDYALWKKAWKEKNKDYCSQLKEYSYDECVFAIAEANDDFSFCNYITDPSLKDKCNELSNYKKAVKENNIQGCLGNSINQYRTQCLSEFFYKFEEIEDCEEFSEEDKIFCEDILRKKIAFKKSDKNECNNIKNEAMKKDCLGIVENKPKDSDNDGLLDVNEKLYGTNIFNSDTDSDGLDDYIEIMKYRTNPKNSDTDGDGYIDGEEIKKGFNPNGEGKL